MTAKPWHKRWHGNALVGLRQLSLELRGAYTTLTDLMYDHGGPIALDERRLCGEMDCDIRVLRRVMGSLFAAEKIRLWTDGNRTYVVNDKVLEVLGVEGFSPETCGELSSDLRDKFAIAIEQLSPNSTGTTNKNNEPKNKNGEKNAPRGRGERKDTPIVPKGDKAESPSISDGVETIWAISPSGSRRRSGKTDIERSLASAVRRGKSIKAIQAGLGAYFASQEATKDGGAFVKGVHRMIEGDRWEAFVETRPPDGPPSPDDPGPWRRRMLDWTKNRYWNSTDWGPKPGSPGCLVPARWLPPPAELLLFPVAERAA